MVVTLFSVLLTAFTCYELGWLKLAGALAHLCLFIAQLLRSAFLLKLAFASHVRLKLLTARPPASGSLASRRSCWCWRSSRCRWPSLTCW